MALDDVLNDEGQGSSQPKPEDDEEQHDDASTSKLLEEDEQEPTTSKPIASSIRHGSRARPPRRLVLHSPSVLLIPQSPRTPLSSGRFTFDTADSPGFATPTPLPRQKDGTFSMFPFETVSLSTLEENPQDDDKQSSYRPSFAASSSRRASRASITVTNWRAVRLISMVLFLMRVQFTFYFASIYPMIRQFDPNTTTTFYAVLCSLYSIGVAVAAPSFGFLAHHFGFRKPALVVLTLILITNVLYVFVDHIPTERRYYVLAIRIVVGVAAGGSSILNTFWSTVTAEKDRATAAAYTDAAFSLGLAFGPLCQLIFSPVGYPGFKLAGVSINMYTLPAISATGIVALILFLMICCFDEPYRPGDDAKFVEAQNEKVKYIETQCDKSKDMCQVDYDSMSDELLEDDVEPIDMVAIFVCFAIKVVQMLFYACLETITSMYIRWMFSLSLDQTTQLGSALVAASGLSGFGFLVVYVWTGSAKKVEDRLAVLFGIALCILFLLVTYPYNFLPGTIQKSDCLYSWCSTTHRVPFPVFAIAYLVLFGIGFPLLNVHSSALLASLVGVGKQPVWHGTSMFVATIPRIAGPYVMIEIMNRAGIATLWMSQMGLVLTLLVIVLCTYNRLGQKVYPLKSLVSRFRNVCAVR